jgi:hypothetical protein
MKGMRQAVAVAAAVGAVGALAAADGASATERDAGHCVLRIVGQERSGRYLTAAPVCYPTLSESLAAAGVPVGRELAGASFDEIERTGALGRAAGPIGIHFDGANRTGASIVVTGTDCSGGYVNLSSDWTNRISSTRNYCPTVVFYDGFDKNGASEVTTTTSVNLGALNNAANSIAYA